MKKILIFSALILASQSLFARQQGKVSFAIEASEDVAADFPGAPQIQSFAFAQSKGRWVFIGGRISGYHAVGGGSAEFLRADANQDVWVVDTNVKPAQTYHLPVTQLPSRFGVIAAQWASAGQLYFQDGDE